MQTIPRALCAHVDRQWAESDAKTRHRDRAMQEAGREYSRPLRCYLVRYNRAGAREWAGFDGGTADVLAATIIGDAAQGKATHVYRDQTHHDSNTGILAFGRPERVQWIGADAARFELAAYLDRNL